jgi:hypothetical protein
MHVILLFAHIVLPTPFVLDGPLHASETLRSILALSTILCGYRTCASDSLSKMVDIVRKKGKKLVKYTVVCERSP